MNNKILPFLLPIGFGIMGGAFADSSPRSYSAQTGSYYQEFYWGNSNEQNTWRGAVTDCKARGGHLVTITSKAENDFINTLVYPYDRTPWIGATDEIVEGQWKWVTGEAWNFTDWDTGYPYTSDDYAWFYADNIVGGGAWRSSSNPSSSYDAYLCEWESDYVLDSAEIGDLTGDGNAEIGVYKLAKGVRTVNLKNPVTNASVGKLTFGTATSIETSFIASVSDWSGNGQREVAVGFRHSNGSFVVYIKDPTNNAVTLKSFWAATNTEEVLSMDSTPDLNGDGVSELQFLIRSTVNGANKIVVRDPKTGTLIKNLTP